MQSQVNNETHSIQPCATARAPSTNLEPTEIRYNSVQVLIFPARRSLILVHKCVDELSAAVPQPQLMLEMRHYLRDGGEH